MRFTFRSFTIRSGVAALAVAAASCGGQAPSPAVDPGRFSGADGTPLTAVAAAATAPSTACGTGAHDRHAGTGIACASCHPCGGTFGFSGAPAFPGGTDPSSAGTLVRDAGGTSCTVACHYPLGAAPHAVSWSTPGPLACSSCHSNVAPADLTYGSAHAIAQTDPVANRSACQSCHDTSQHTSGHVRVDVGSGVVDATTSGDRTALNPICLGCHSGTGRTIADQTPPALPGWTSPTGDFHGARAGTGFGGTLVAPYQVGQGPLACTECHDAHASPNAFLFAARAGGQAVTTPIAIDRAGVGAEALCENCHQGNHHEGCMTTSCHATDPAPPGAPCFFCHGHEGIVNFVMPSWDNHPNYGQTYCSHCHGGDWFPSVVDHTPPKFLSGPIAVATGSAVTVTWTTDEAATSFVEFGTSTLSSVQGDGTLVTSHSVTVGGLSELTSYGYRARSSDALRNVALSATGAFTTASASAPAAPVLSAQPDATWESDTQIPPYVATFTWSAVTAPDGDPVEYRFQLGTDSTFASPGVDTVAPSATLQQAIDVPVYPGATYWWRVQARDAVHPAFASSWSAPDSFLVYWSLPPPY